MVSSIHVLCPVALALAVACAPGPQPDVRCGDRVDAQPATVTFTPASASEVAFLGQGSTPEGELVDDIYRDVVDASFSFPATELVASTSFSAGTLPLTAGSSGNGTRFLADATAEVAWREAQEDAAFPLTFGNEYYATGPTFDALFGEITPAGASAPGLSGVVHLLEGYQIFLSNIIVRGGNECAEAALAELGAGAVDEVVPSGGTLEVNVFSNLDEALWTAAFDPARCTTADIEDCTNHVLEIRNAVETRSDEELAAMDLSTDLRWDLVRASLGPVR